MSDKSLPQKEEPLSEENLQLSADKIMVRGQAIKISKRLDAAIDKIYQGFISLKEACCEACRICKEEGIQEDLIGEIIRLALKRRGLSERSVLRYLPDELKDHSKVHPPSLPTQQLPPTKLSANEGKNDEEQLSNTLDYKSLYETERQKRTRLEDQFRAASFKPAADIVADPNEEKLKQIQDGHERALRDLEEKKNTQIQETIYERDNWKQRYEDFQNNLRESQEFKNATGQIKSAYEDQINHWRKECEKAKRPKAIEFALSRLKCLDIILQNQNGVLYLEHDGYKVIRVNLVNPIAQSGETVS
jgi:hypothetical protein